MMGQRWPYMLREGPALLRKAEGTRERKGHLVTAFKLIALSFQRLSRDVVGEQWCVHSEEGKQTRFEDVGARTRVCIPTQRGWSHLSGLFVL